MGSGFNTLPLHPHKQIFIDSSGLPCRMSGISAFNLLDLYSKGLFPENFLSYFPESNLVRIFLYTEWGADSWHIPNFEVAANFISYMGKLDCRVLLTLLTDDDGNKIQKVIDLVKYLTGFNFTNLLLAAGNEPFTHKNIDVNALKNVLESSGYLYSSGVYEDLAKFYGNFGDEHSGRDIEWPRKAKDVIECYRGGGPNYKTEPACPVPWILGEPIRPDEAIGYPYNTELDYYTYGSLCGAMGAGGIFHFENGKLCSIPTNFELQCYSAFNEGLNVFPTDTALGNYNRIDEHGDTLRTYTVGDVAVRVRPIEGIEPFEGYNHLDDYGVCWIR